MYKDELRMSQNVDEQPPVSTLKPCRHRGPGLVVFVCAPDAPHCPHVHVLEGGVVLAVARHLEAPDSVRNVLKSVVEELDLCQPQRLLLRPSQLHGLACSDSQKIKPGSQNGSQVIYETCGRAMYKGGGGFPSVFRLREARVLGEKPPVTLSILRMVDKAFELVITTFNPAFGKPFGGPENGFDPALRTWKVRLKPVSAHLQLLINIHTHLKTVLLDPRHNFKGTFRKGEELGVFILGSFALAEQNTFSFFEILWFLSALVGNAQPICLKFLNEALGLFFTRRNVVEKC